MSWGWLPWAMVFTWSHYLRIIEKVPKHGFVTLTAAKEGSRAGAGAGARK